MSAVIPALLGFAITISAVFAGLGHVMDIQAEQAAANTGSFKQQFASLHTDVRPTAATEAGFITYSEVDVTLTNAGALSLADFAGWDVVVNYVATGGIQTRAYLPYSTVAADNTWRVEDIYLDAGTATAELLGPGVLNPHEEAVVRLRVSPAVSAGTTGEVVISPGTTRTGYVQFES